MASVFPRVLGGAIAGIVATGVMSAHMLGRPSLERIGTPPPERIASSLLATEPDAVRRVAATVVHLAIGASAGAVYGAVRHRNALGGALFGLGVWAIGYELVLPALGILPPAHRDDPERRAALIQAHLVFGAALGRLSE